MLDVLEIRYCGAVDVMRLIHMLCSGDAQTRENRVSHGTGPRPALRESCEPPDRAMPSPARILVRLASVGELVCLGCI